MHIKNEVAVVGREAFAQARLSAQLDQFARHIRARHRNHFDR